MLALNLRTAIKQLGVGGEGPGFGLDSSLDATKSRAPDRLLSMLEASSREFAVPLEVRPSSLAQRQRSTDHVVHSNSKNTITSLLASGRKLE